MLFFFTQKYYYLASDSNSLHQVKPKGHYVPQTRVDWTSTIVFSQFKLWQKEVERIINGPLASRSDKVKLNHVYIWAGAQAEYLIEARTSEDPTITITSPSILLDQLTACITHPTFFREQREEFYNAKQKPGENTTAYFSRIMDLYRQAEFPQNSNFIIADKLIHGCANKECKKKLMAKTKDISTKECLEIMRKLESVDATMKKSDASDEAKIDASYAQDPTKRSQRNGSKGKQRGSRPKMPNKKICIWCKGDTHSRDKYPAKNSTCRFCKKQGHFERACLQKERKSRSQHVVEVMSDQDSSSDYGDNFDLGQVTVDTVRSTEAREIFAPVMFHPKEKRGTSVSIKGKVDTGAMVSCMPASMVPQLGLSTSDLQPSHAIIRGMSGTDLQNCGTIDISVSCNAITANTKFYVTKCECAFVLGLGFCKTFKLVSVASVCTQHSISMETQGMEAVHITNESEANYSQLNKKWNKHLPLGKKTGNPLEDLKQIFPETFDGRVGRFEGEVNLKVSPNAKPTQLPP